MKYSQSAILYHNGEYFVLGGRGGGGFNIRGRGFSSLYCHIFPSVLLRTSKDMVSYNAVITAFEEGSVWQMAGQMLLEIEEQNSHGDVT